MDEIKYLLNDIKKELNQIKEEMNLSNIKNETLYNEIHTKVDIICNCDPINNTNKSKQDNGTIKKPDTKITFFKKSFKENINEFINILYTQEDLDKYMEHDDVKSKNTQTDKIKKLADIIYKEVVNKTGNTEYKLQLTSIHKEYVKKLSEPEMIKTDEEN